MILQDKVLTRTCQFYYDYFGPHNRNLYGKRQFGRFGGSVRGWLRGQTWGCCMHAA